MGSRNKRRLALGAAAVTGLAATGITLAVLDTASTRWSELQSWMVREQDRWVAQHGVRAAVWGETRPGRAFAHYEEASRIGADLLRRRGADRGLKALRHHPEELSAAEAEAIRSAWSPAVTAMCAGAHCDDARPLLRFEDGFKGQATNLDSGRWVVNMACLSANDLLAAGRGREAVERTLDAATYGADLVQSPMLIDQMIGAALLIIATAEEWTEERLGQLDVPSLELLALGLQRLDERVPVAMQLRGETLLMAHSMVSNRSPDQLLVSPIAAWRFGFSMRWMTADAVREISATLDRLDAAAELTWPRRERMIDEQRDELARSGNPIVEAGWSHLLVAERTIRQAVAGLRILRVAVDARLGRELPALEDPLGDGALELFETDSGLRIRSDGSKRNARLVRDVARPAPR